MYVIGSDFGAGSTADRETRSPKCAMRRTPDPDVLDETSYILRDKKKKPSSLSSSSSSSQSSPREYRIAEPEAADEEWAWYVMGGCAFANFLLPGMLRSFVPDVLDEFVTVGRLDQSSSCAGGAGSVSRWIPVTFDLTFSIAGSLSCMLCELTSHRAVTFWGGLIASVGMMSSTFANSIPYLYISYGVMVGVGAGLCYPAGILIVNQYFTDYRGLANGLSLVGTTVGSIALPPYIKLMTSSYGYRGGILIVSGIMLNVLAIALIYKPIADEHDCRHVALVSSTPIRVASNVHVQRPPCGGGRRRLFGGASATALLAVCAVNAIGHLARGAFVAVATPRPVALRLAAADAAGRVLGPAASDLLSTSRGSASTYLYVAVAAAGGAVLLATAATADSARGPSTSEYLLAAFGLVSGAAVGLEPLVAVHVFGHGRLAAACSAAMLGKGAAQLAVDLLQLLAAATAPPRIVALCQTATLYALGSCLLATAAAWTTAFLVGHYRHVVAAGGVCNRYQRTA